MHLVLHVEPREVWEVNLHPASSLSRHQDNQSDACLLRLHPLQQEVATENVFWNHINLRSKHCRHAVPGLGCHGLIPVCMPSFQATLSSSISDIRCAHPNCTCKSPACRLEVALGCPLKHMHPQQAPHAVHSLAKALALTSSTSS